VSSANQAGSIELATSQPVMAMGGFSGSDPTPTLEQLQSVIAHGELRYVIVGGAGLGGPGGGFRGPGGAQGGGTSDIASWVTSTCTAVTSVSSSLYDCAGAAAGGQAFSSDRPGSPPPGPSAEGRTRAGRHAVS
jgi:hypothetical protein